MGVQQRKDNNTRPFVIHSLPAVQESAGILLTNAKRDGPIVPFTLLAKIAASGKYVPLATLNAVTGASIPAGIYIGPEISEEDIQAADVLDLQVLKSGAHFDAAQLVIEGGLTLNSVVVPVVVTQDPKDDDVTVTASNQLTLRDHLIRLNLIPVLTDSVSNFENVEE